MATQVKIETEVHREHRTVECTNCKTKQKVHVMAPTGATPLTAQSMQCINCYRHFVVMVPHNIVRGPFPL